MSMNHFSRGRIAWSILGRRSTNPRGRARLPAGRKRRLAGEESTRPVWDCHRTADQARGSLGVVPGGSVGRHIWQSHGSCLENGYMVARLLIRFLSFSTWGSTFSIYL